MTGHWTDKAACKGDDRMLLDPWENGLEVEERQLRKCERTEQIERCGYCPVRAECLASALREEYGLQYSYLEGIRGGLTARQRYAINQESKQSKAAEGICECGQPSDGRHYLCGSCRWNKWLNKSPNAWERTCVQCGGVSKGRDKMKDNMCGSCTDPRASERARRSELRPERLRVVA